MTNRRTSIRNVNWNGFPPFEHNKNVGLRKATKRVAKAFKNLNAMFKRLGMAADDAALASSKFSAVVSSAASDG